MQKRGANAPRFRLVCNFLDFFCNLGSLAYAAAQVVQLGAADLTVAHNLEL